MLDAPAVLRDRAEHDRSPATQLDYLRHAHERSGRHPLELAREFLRLNRGPGKLSFPEYVRYGVYDTSRHDRESQSHFVTDTLVWPITHACCDMTWQAATEDKWLCSRILAGTGVPTPETLAVIDRTEREYAGTTTIRNVRQLREFMRSGDALPLFGKANRGLASFGAFLAERADEHGVRVRGEGWLPYETLMDRFIGETPYLLQRLETNHPFFGSFTSALASVRIYVMVSAARVTIPAAVLKIPSATNVADNFWRPGNLACDLRPGSGRISTLRSRSALGTTDHDRHPETGAVLVGKHVPMWDRVVALAERCAPIFAPIRYQSMDIAVTGDGPVLVEINTGGAFELPQLASGEGFLKDEVREFFRRHGYRRL